MSVLSKIIPRLGGVRPKMAWIVAHRPLWNNHPTTRLPVRCKIGAFEQRKEHFRFKLHEFSQPVNKLTRLNARCRVAIRGSPSAGKVLYQSLITKLFSRLGTERAFRESTLLVKRLTVHDALLHYAMIDLRYNCRIAAIPLRKTPVQEPDTRFSQTGSVLRCWFIEYTRLRLRINPIPQDALKSPYLARANCSP